MDRRPTYLFSGGGTGGHLFPGIAVAHELLRRDERTRILFAGSGREIERQIIAQHGYDHCRLSAEPSTTIRRNPLKFAWRNWRAVRTAGSILRRERPAAVIGLGGFASVPAVLAASRLGIPTVLLEQNSVAGRTTRWLSRRADLVCLSFEQTADTLPKRVNTCVTGNPVRRPIAELHSRPLDGSTHTPPTLLVLGGSQGAISLNEAVVDAVTSLRTELAVWKIVHQTGKQQAGRVRRRYQDMGIDSVVAPFFSELIQWYRRADLVISRAGATTLAELACAGSPAVLVPYPNSVGNHQLWNARAHETAGAARVIEQNGNPNKTSQTLARQMGPLLRDGDLRGQMRRAAWTLARPRAAMDVVDRLPQP